MTVGSRALTSVLLAGLVLATSGCLPDIPEASPPTRTATLVVDPPPTRSATPSASATGGPSSTATSASSGSPTTAPSTPFTPAPPIPSVSLPPDLEPCPVADDLAVTFEVVGIGTHPASGHDLVKVTVAYTNPRPYPLWLMASIGYLDPAGDDQFLYYTPGGLPFEDEQLAPGPGTRIVELEDMWGQSEESDLYLSYWALAGAPVGATEVPPCAPTRGIYTPPPVPEDAQGD